MSINDRGTTTSVFISVGHQLSRDQTRFTDLVMRLLSQFDVTPIRVERNAQMISDPISTIRNIIRKSAGTIIIAFERYRIISGVEFPTSQNPAPLSPKSIATVWNQIEAAMTLQIEHPLLILSEEAIYPEGVIDPAIHPIISFRVDTITDKLPKVIEDSLKEWCSWL